MNEKKETDETEIATKDLFNQHKKISEYWPQPCPPVLFSFHISHRSRRWPTGWQSGWSSPWVAALSGCWRGASPGLESVWLSLTVTQFSSAFTFGLFYFSSKKIINKSSPSQEIWLPPSLYRRTGLPASSAPGHCQALSHQSISDWWQACSSAPRLGNRYIYY